MKLLLEVGRKLSKANESRLRKAMQEMADVLSQLQAEEAVTEAERSFAARAALICDAIRGRVKTDVQSGEWAPYTYVSDVFDDYFVYCTDGESYRLDYMIADDGTVTLGDTPVEVLPTMTYPDAPMDAEDVAERDIPDSARKKMAASDFAGKNRSFPIATPADVAAAAKSLGRAGSDNYSTDQIKANIIKIAKRKGASFVAQLPKAWKESVAAEEHSEEAIHEADLIGETVPLIEASTGLHEAAAAHFKLISPGWGSSGYYSEALLKRDGPTIFPSGTQMFWDHQTPAQESAQPEGSLDRLVGATTGPATYMEAGAKGPGLYAPGIVYDHWKAPVAEMAADIGLSIRASGSTRMGEAEGRKGPIVMSMTHGKSVDYVTRAGRGGEVVGLFEAAGRRVSAAIPKTEETEMTEAEIKALREQAATAEAEKTRLQARLLLHESKAFVAETLAKIEMPVAVRERLIASLAPQYSTTAQGDLDVVAFKPIIESRATEELSYIAAITGAGSVRGLGGSTAATSAANGPSIEDSRKRIAEGMVRLSGLSEAAAKRAAEGRATYVA